jgi:hypothetical protein
MTQTNTTARVYPLPQPANDARFTYGLLFDVAAVLEKHGYPRPKSGGDLVALHLALFTFLYDTDARRADP